MTDKNIKVEIWSDVACPFCYIGKRNFEKALSDFKHNDKVEVLWKSFQLNPNEKKENNIDINQMLASKYGRSVDWAKQMNENVTKTAKEVGLNFDLNKIKLTNTLDSHQLIHLAKKYNLQDKAKERLLSAYFVEGLHLGKREVIIQLAKEIGINESDVEKMLENNEYVTDVKSDIIEAQHLGVTGVPFFVFNQKYAVSGAQPNEVFLDVLEKIAKEELLLEDKIEDKNICSPDGVCSV
jgi:predicted DsbA family dithiol-disulfide isomerase